jgi:hypothetical protein
MKGLKVCCFQGECYRRAKSVLFSEAEGYERAKSVLFSGKML